MKEHPELVKFPCRYPLKVMGKNTNEFLAVVTGIIEKHLHRGTPVNYSTRASSGGKYLSITATFEAQSQTQLSAIYQELRVHELVLLTL